MSNYQEDLIPVDFILMIAEGTSIKMASVALIALIDNWKQNGKEWSEAGEDIYYE